ncbi:MAG TPA: carboxypeptidase-like regulatory domain-containing protein [Blastocatellia bacterium]|nr:carboxypeptidase-like regulatory domain-containing protein [Blastocatellia bacterium]
MRMILLLLLSFSSWSVSPAANAQRTGVITGRVIAEDGRGMPKVSVELYPVNTGQRNAGGQLSTTTDEEGNFKFTGLLARAYFIYANDSRDYVNQFAPNSERNYYHIGDHVMITMICGGVITGRVTTAEGESMIGAEVNATLTRDAEGNPVRRQYGVRRRWSDDRGIYRLYGLAPGTYVVAVRSALSLQQVLPYSGETPTYHPSSTRDTAAEVSVPSGGEVVGIDIRYRGDRGHTVSGAITGAEASRAVISLFSVAAGAYVGWGNVRPGEAANSFAIEGVSDGEYEVVAQSSGSNDTESFVTPPRRVSVRGADVGGIELKLAPRASITGRVVVENQPKVCETKGIFSIEEVVVLLRRDEKALDSRSVYQAYLADVSPDDKGEFAIRSLDPGRYFIQPRLPAENWYLKSITAPPIAAGNTRKPGSATDIARSGFALKAGEKFSGLTVTIASGAASLSGKVVAAKEGTRLPFRLRVHLAPADAAGAGDPLRYAESIVRPGGAFELKNIAPGKYWLVARAAPDDDSVDNPSLPIAWDASERAKLRREAEASKVEVELNPCQHVSEQIVKFTK